MWDDDKDVLHDPLAASDDMLSDDDDTSTDSDLEDGAVEEVASPEADDEEEY